MGDISGLLLKEISKIDEYKGMWKAGEILHPQILKRLKRSVLITSTGASTRIEGVKLSDEDIDKLIDKINIQKFTNRDEQEVKGYYELLENVFNSWERLELSEGTIKHFHKELLKYVAKDSAHTPPLEMQELVEWTRAELSSKNNHPLLVIGNFIVAFLAIHPFEDGNGRLSRILTNFLLLKAGYAYVPYISHEKLIEDNKKGYYIALQKSQKSFKSKNDTIIPWLEYFLNIFLLQSKMAVELTENKNIESILSEKQLLVWNYLQENKGAGVGEISKATKVPIPTVKQAINKLLKLKKIEMSGMGRAVRYRLR
jgi:Fic family protein